MRAIAAARRSRHRRAFSLAEMLLTLALSVMLMAMVGTAFSFYATKLDVRNTQVRRVQLAQAILDMIADDLRCAIHPPKFDDAALVALLSTATGGGGAVPGEGEDLSAAGLDDLSDPDDTGEGDPSLDDSSGSGSGAGDSGATIASSETMATTDLGAATATTSRPGLMGNQTQIQFDISRLPRLEEYQPAVVGDTLAEMTDVPSDIKTVTYYLQNAGGGVVDPLAVPGAEDSFWGSAGAANGGGLVRRSLDRAITQWAMQNGGLVSLTATGDLVATEVVGIEFQYWDGLMWQTYWNSDEKDALPLAVRVTLTMLEPGTDESAAGSSAIRTRVYEQIVRLPMARAAATQSTTDLSAAGL